MGTDQPTDGRTNGPTNGVSYRGAVSCLKRLRKKVALIKTDYEERKMQPTPAGHPQLATPRANHFLLVCLHFVNKNKKTHFMDH
jgi:hypothetical protein